MSTKEFLKLARQTCIKAVRQLCPDETGLFELVWDALIPTFRRWQRLPADQWEVDFTEFRRPGGYAWPGPMDASRLHVLRASSAITGALLQLASEPSPVSSERIEKVLLGFVDRMAVPGSSATLVRAVAPLIQADLTALGAPLQWPEPQRLWLYDSEEGRVQITDEEVEALKSEEVLRDYDLFLDTLRLKLWLRGKERNLPKQLTDLCAFLLRRVGRSFTQWDAELALWGGRTVDKGTYSKALERFHKATDGVLEPYVEHPTGAEHTSVKKGLRYRMIAIE